MITGTGLSESLTHLFATVTSRCTFVVLVGAYSAGLECSFPGRKQVGRGSVLSHGSCNRQSRAPLDWVIHIYNASEALPNLVNLFWMLRLLGILKPRARDLARIRHVATRGPGADRVPIVLAVFAVDPVRASHEIAIVLNAAASIQADASKREPGFPPALLLRCLKLQTQCHLDYSRSARVAVVEGGRAAQGAERAVVHPTRSRASTAKLV